MEFILSDHVEAPADAPSSAIYDSVVRQSQLAERLGFSTVWFSEHHAHAHHGHMPAPLLLAMYVASQTRTLRAGTSVMCLNIHHPLEVAEHLAVADVLTKGRLSIGLGSGSTPAEAQTFGMALADRDDRHQRFVEALDVLDMAWSGESVQFTGRFYTVACPPVLPKPSAALRGGLGIAATSVESAALAGRRGVGLMLPRERAYGYLGPLIEAYRAGRGESDLPPEGGRVSVGVALYVGASDTAAQRESERAVQRMVQRNRQERAAVAALPMPKTWREQLDQALFLAGSPTTCVEALVALHHRAPFTALDVQPRWDGLDEELIERSLERFAREVMPALREAVG